MQFLMLGPTAKGYSTQMNHLILNYGVILKIKWATLTLIPSVVLQRMTDCWHIVVLHVVAVISEASTVVVINGVSRSVA